jgi:hypothetical protein
VFCGARIAALRNLSEVCANLPHSKCTSFGIGYTVFLDVGMVCDCGHGMLGS